MTVSFLPSEPGLYYGCLDRQDFVETLIINRKSDLTLNSKSELHNQAVTRISARRKLGNLDMAELFTEMKLRVHEVDLS